MHDKIKCFKLLLKAKITNNEICTINRFNSHSLEQLIAAITNTANKILTALLIVMDNSNKIPA